MSNPVNTPDRKSQKGKRPVVSLDPHGLSSPFQNVLPFAQSNGGSSSENLQYFDEKQDPYTGRRGRRRRSSEFVQFQDEMEGTSDIPCGDGATQSQSLLWWQRPKSDRDNPQSSHQPTLYPLKVDSETVISSSPSSASLRSPAANFLSSMNESLGSPPSILGTLNQSYQGNQARPAESSNTRDSIYGHSPRHHPMHGSEGSPLGLASAAAQLYKSEDQPSSSSSPGHNSNHSSKLDAEGSRIGANGRYLLGKTIGFGGFSTIREAWDLGEDAAGTYTERVQGMHRVAVKIVYSSELKDGIDHIPNDVELKIWERIPLHPNILPLLHYEKAKMDGSSKDSSTIAFLVMPYCQGSLLTYVKNEGTLSDSILLPTEGVESLSRSASLHGSQIMSPLSDLQADQNSQNRTGSGFIPRTAAMRVTSVPLSHLMGRSTSSVGSSSSLLRRASSRISRPQKQTNGVPFQAVKDVMKQLVDAIFCLHCKANVLHGDLKLENVLGQQSISAFHRDRTTSGSSNDDERTAGESDSLQSSYHDAQSSVREKICWRIADFGASIQMPSEKHRHFFKESKWAKKEIKGITGGSLAYTAPEFFIPDDLNHINEEAENDEISPYAPDMWALGCILYCLCSGRLPFNDSFEPRLQMKIAKGSWEMPPRLQRRDERRHSTVETNRQRQQSTDRVISNITRGTPRNSSLSMSLASSRPSHLSNIPSNASDVIDMSASMPALQDRNHLFNSGIGSTSQHSIIVNDGGDVSKSFEEDEQEDSSTESDADERIDQDLDATSRDRVQIRLALRKLLQPNPRKRWTIAQLAKQPWMSKSSALQRMSQFDNEEADAQIGTEPNQSASFLEHPSLAFGSISEHASQENVTTFSDDNISRGRSKRRGNVDLNQSRAAKPIDIDRSSSRSRSRPDLDRFRSSLWNGNAVNSSFESRYRQSKGSDNDVSYTVGERRIKRSASEDTRSAADRGRSSSSLTRAQQRSISRPPRLDMIELENNLPSIASDRYNTAAATTVSSSSSANRSTTSRSRSRARDALNDIASRGQSRGGSPATANTKQQQHQHQHQQQLATVEEKLWWQRGRRNGR